MLPQIAATLVVLSSPQYYSDPSSGQVHYCFVEWRKDQVEILEFCPSSTPPAPSQESEKEASFAKEYSQFFGLTGGEVNRLIRHYNQSLCSLVEQAKQESTFGLTMDGLRVMTPTLEGRAEAITNNLLYNMTRQEREESSSINKYMANFANFINVFYKEEANRLATTESCF